MNNKNYGFRYLADGFYATNNTFDSKKNNNDLLIGGSSSGKTSTYIFQNICSPNESLVISDTKSQLYKMTKDRLESLGYKTYLLDFVEPENSTVGFNCLDMINVSENGQIREQDVISLATNLVPLSPGEREPIWTLSARENVMMLISFCMEALDKSSWNMKSVVDLCRAFYTPEGEKEFADWFSSHPDTFSARKYDEYCANKNADKMVASIRQFVNTALSAFTFREINNITSNKESFDFSRLGKERIALFVNVSDIDTSLHTLANLVYVCALSKLIKDADSHENGRLDYPVRFIFDDFAAGNRIENFDRIISTIRSRDIYVSCAIQSLNQLTHSYGQDCSQTIIANFDHIIYMGSNELDTAKYISFRINKTVDYVLNNIPLDKVYIITRGQAAILCNKGKPFELADNSLEDDIDDLYEIYG